jgi:glutamine cyclotransferase
MARAAWRRLVPPPPSSARFTLQRTFPHDPDAFTQGLAYLGDGVLLESTGLYGKSSLRRVRLETGEVLQKLELAPEHFGEGVAVFEDRVFQLTWQSGVAFVYDRETLRLLRTFTYPTEGWGLTHDGRWLIMSDGSSTLRFVDPGTFAVVRRLRVTSRGRQVRPLNDLEFVDGFVYANVWRSDRVARIDAASGHVTAWLDLSGLLTAPDRERPVDVLNGLAHDPRSGRLFVTGKLWPKIFAIDVAT